MRKPSILAVAALALLGVALAGNHAFGRLPLTRLRVVPVAEFPRQVGGWTAKADRPLDAETRKALPTASVLDRVYLSRSGMPLNLVLVSAGNYKDFHDPNVCFPSQGYQLGEETTCRVGGRGMSEMVARKEGSGIAVLFWLEGDQLPGVPNTSLWGKISGLRRLVTREQGQTLFVRVTAPEGPEARGEMRAFAQAILPSVRALLRSGAPTGGEGRA
ncbi:MAG: exosortase-associated EpsI family protein [Chthonomonadales bacterium]|nr:exosortase-associated EpsI family protein [Chthonomonadales bacterium]